MQKLLTLSKAGIIIKIQNAFNKFINSPFGKDSNYEENFYSDHGCFDFLHHSVLMQFDRQKQNFRKYKRQFGIYRRSKRTRGF